MKVGIFDSGLGGLTIVQAIAKSFKGAQVVYIADTLFAPYGEKSKEQILKHSLDVTNYLINNHNIDALIIACNTATSAAIKYLREKFPKLILIGTEPGIKPAMQKSISKNIGVLATAATLKGDKYQKLLKELSLEHKVCVYESACIGLVEQIEDGKIKDLKTVEMLEKWLFPMMEKKVDTIVLGCTHYPLVSEVIKNIMGTNIKLVETGTAIANRLHDLSLENGHNNSGKLNITVFYTGNINLKMVNIILDSWNNGGEIEVRNANG